jgi:hypothetical protein
VTLGRSTLAPLTSQNTAGNVWISRQRWFRVLLLDLDKGQRVILCQKKIAPLVCRLLIDKMANVPDRRICVTIDAEAP